MVTKKIPRTKNTKTAVETPSSKVVAKPVEPEVVLDVDDVSEEDIAINNEPLDFDVSDYKILDVEDDDIAIEGSSAELEPITKGRKTKKSARKADGTREIVSYDPLTAYLREIQKYKPLTREEEKDLALKVYENKDRDAAVKLISSNLWLVVKLARDYERAARNVLDLIQEGNIGLMEAVKNFDPYREVRFPSYAVWWIKAYIIRYVIANWRLVKIGTTQAQRKLFFNLKKEKDRQEKEGFFPGPKLIAENLNVRESDVVEMEQRLGSADVSVDAPLSSDADATLLSLLPNNQASAEDLMAQGEMNKLLHDGLEEFAASLSEKEAAIFQERLLSEDKATLQDLAEKFDLSRERIRQLESRVKSKLKDFLTEKYGSTLDGMFSFND